MAASTIPKTRSDLVHMVTRNYESLHREIAEVDDAAAAQRCVDEWTVKDLLAVRVWWSQRVADWIEAGRRGDVPELPAEGFTWRQTPALNEQIAEASRSRPWSEIRDQLHAGFQRISALIDDLDDRELLEVGVFEWAGTHPLARWISLSTARQYTTARTFIRRMRHSAP